MANLDPETYEYELLFDVYSYIPREDLKSELDAGFDEQVTEDAVNNSCFYLQYFPDGWPREVIYQEGVTIGDRGKLKQTYIEWDYRSVGHTN